MSSMLRERLANGPMFALFASLLMSAPSGAGAQEAAAWDAARGELVARQPGPVAADIARWQVLYGDTGAARPFADYASFLVSNPGYPDEATLRGRAEARLASEFVPPERVLAYFAAMPPLTNPGRAQHALVLAGRDHDASARTAREAWRGGAMSETAEAALFAMHGAHFTQDDHNARMDALLWQRERAAAARQLERVAPSTRRVFAARLAILTGGDGFTDAPEAAGDPGYLFNRSRELRQKGRASQAVQLIAGGPPLARLPLDQTAWVGELLALARASGARDAARLAAVAPNAFAPGTDISRLSFRLRDDYTSLMWLGGSAALWQLGDGMAAAPLFHAYGAAARTGQTRSKGFFWAGEAAHRAGNAAEAARYWEMAAAYPERFYGQMAHARLGRTLPPMTGSPVAEPSDQARADFNARPLTRAVAEVARDAPWSTGIRFYRAIADQAETAEDHMLVAELARQTGRRDLAVNLFDAADADGHDGFTTIGFPLLENPPGTNWTMVHAITRQESQFAQNAISHAGARGLMQLMPATAREEAGRSGMTYMAASLIDDPAYNVRLGSNYFERLLRQYNNSYPLAIAAYNGGAGNVNRWLRENGDPRRGEIGWLEWIERIGFSETRTYVQKVIENAVVYETLYPERASAVRPRGVEDFLR